MTTDGAATDGGHMRYTIILLGGLGLGRTRFSTTGAAGEGRSERLERATSHALTAVTIIRVFYYNIILCSILNDNNIRAREVLKIY